MEWIIVHAMCQRLRLIKLWATDKRETETSTATRVCAFTTDFAVEATLKLWWLKNKSFTLSYMPVVDWVVLLIWAWHHPVNGTMVSSSLPCWLCLSGLGATICLRSQPGQLGWFCLAFCCAPHVCPHREGSEKRESGMKKWVPKPMLMSNLIMTQNKSRKSPSEAKVRENNSDKAEDTHLESPLMGLTYTIDWPLEQEQLYKAAHFSGACRHVTTGVMR